MNMYYAYEGIANNYSKRSMDELTAPRYIMPMIVSSSVV